MPIKAPAAERKKLCMISSSGGHYEELQMLKKLGERYALLWITEQTSYAADADYYLKQTGSNDPWVLIRMLENCFRSFRIWIRERPYAVITTGTLVALPICFLAKLCGKKVIYIETFARVHDCTKAGKLMYRVADLFIYQWEDLKAFYPKGVYGGSVY